MNGEPEKIRITSEDLANLAPAPAADTRDYGSVAEASDPAPVEKGSIFRQAWCYLGLAGFTGALAAWGICEPWFIDNGSGVSWANHIIFPLMLVLICTGFALAESMVEHAPRKAALRVLMALGIGTVLGFVFFFIANLIFSIGLGILARTGNLTVRSPALWITRAVAWMGFGVAGGVVYGIIGQSGKKCLYGIAGGVLGAGLGGLIFDPISIPLGGAGASRAIGMALFGLATGAAVGLVEGALKDRWLYVSAGPLAGKQFILYKPVTTIGSSQACDIYLFKDPDVAPQHASIEVRGAYSLLRAAGPVSVNRRGVREVALASGQTIQIGRYSFLYRDRERDAR